MKKIYKVGSTNKEARLIVDIFKDMNRDTDELPSIMAELEESIFSIESSQ